MIEKQNEYLKKNNIANLLFFSTLLFLLTYTSCIKEPSQINLCKKESSSAIVQNPRVNRIGVRLNSINSQEFYDKGNGTKFTPRGYNYTDVRTFTYDGIELTGHCTFNTNKYDSEEAELMLVKLQKSGYNTVRVFLNPLSMADNVGAVNPDYMANVANFLTKADNYGLSVIITLDMIPLKSYGTPIQNEADIWWWNDQYIYDAQITLETDFWKSFIIALKNIQAPLRAILSYEIRNEFFFHPDHPPLNQSQGQIMHPNLQTYDMSIENDKTKLVEAAFLYWSSTVRDAILIEDPEALVSVGFYAPEPYKKPAIVAIEQSQLDFVDLHLYPYDFSKADYAAYFNLAQNANKLIIMGEFGVVEDNNNKTITEISNLLFSWKNDFEQDFNLDGWLIWSWETDKGAKLSVSDKDCILFETLSPN
jgi:hypothetical protein